MLPLWSSPALELKISPQYWSLSPALSALMEIWPLLHPLWESYEQISILLENVATYNALCSRNFQNVKLKLDFVKIWWFYRHSDFAWNQIWPNLKGPKMSFLAILEFLSFDFEYIWATFKFKICQNSKFRASKNVINDIFGPFDFTQ